MTDEAWLLLVIIITAAILTGIATIISLLEDIKKELGKGQ